MQLLANKLVFSPSDLIKFMESEYITWMDRRQNWRESIFALEGIQQNSEVLKYQGAVAR